jgi:hypothetical protein
MLLVEGFVDDVLCGELRIFHSRAIGLTADTVLAPAAIPAMLRTAAGLIVLSA